MISSYKLQEPIYTGQTLPVLQRPERDRKRQQVRASTSLVAIQTLPDTMRYKRRTSGHLRPASRSTLPRPPRPARKHVCGCRTPSTCLGWSKILAGRPSVQSFFPTQSFHPCLAAKRSLAWVKICKALTRNTDISKSENIRGKPSAFSAYKHTCHNICFPKVKRRSASLL